MMPDRPCSNPLMEEIDEDIRKNGDIRITKKELEEIRKRQYGDKEIPVFNLEKIMKED